MLFFCGSSVSSYRKKHKGSVVWIAEKPSANGDSIIVFCPQAEASALADGGASTMLTAGPASQVNTVSFGNLLFEVTLMGSHLLTFQARGERTSLCCTSADRGFVAVVFDKVADSSLWTSGYLMP